jgi:dCMP deaminase
MKKKFIDAYMDTATRFSELSDARRLKVGSIIVKEDRIISIGYNGMPAGWDNNCENIELIPDDLMNSLSIKELENQWPFTGKFWINGQEVDTRYRLTTKPEVLHAETNAIDKLAKSNESGLGATMFITHAPCLDCAKLIYQSGIGSVLSRNSYRDTSGVTFLEQSGIEVTQI